MLLRISCRNDNRNHKKKKKRNPKNNNKRRCYYFLLSLPPSFFFLSFFFLDSFVEKTMAHDGGLIIKKGEPNGRQSLDEFNFAFFFFFSRLLSAGNLKLVCGCCDNLHLYRKKKKKSLRLSRYLVKIFFFFSKPK